MFDDKQRRFPRKSLLEPRPYRGRRRPRVIQFGDDVVPKYDPIDPLFFVSADLAAPPHPIRDRCARSVRLDFSNATDAAQRRSSSYPVEESQLDAHCSAARTRSDTAGRWMFCGRTTLYLAARITLCWTTQHALSAHLAAAASVAASAGRGDGVGQRVRAPGQPVQCRIGRELVGPRPLPSPTSSIVLRLQGDGRALSLPIAGHLPPSLGKPPSRTTAPWLGT